MLQSSTCSAQRVNVHWSCDFERNKDCDASNSTKESRQPGTQGAPRSCQNKGETQDESLVVGDGSGCRKAVFGVLWVPTCDHVLPSPVKPTPMPQRPWEDLALDILGPLPSGENLLVLVDYHSRWIEVDVVRATSSKIIIQRLDA